MANNKKVKRTKKYWYATDTYECPICGREEIYKSRQYSKKPNDYNKRNVVRDSYDYCDV